MKLVINDCYGGFQLSEAAWTLAENCCRQEGRALPENLRDWERDDPVLIRIVEELGPAASGEVANLVVVDLPDGMDPEIVQNDGWEYIEGWP